MRSFVQFCFSISITTRSNHRTPWLWFFSPPALLLLCNAPSEENAVSSCGARRSHGMCLAVHKEAAATAAAVVAYDDRPKMSLEAIYMLYAVEEYTLQ